MTLKSGDEYKGEFKEGKFHGNGFYKCASGRIYSGEWKNGDTHGNGIETKPDGSKFVGKFENGAEGIGVIYKNSTCPGKKAEYHKGKFIRFLE